MYNNRYVTELSISEVKEYYEKLRENIETTFEEVVDYELCKERLIDYAYKNIDMIDKIRAEIKALSNVNPSYWHSGDMVDRDDVIEIIDKYKAESEDKE